MAIIPSSTQFVGISPSVNLEEKKSNRLNAETQPYTMQDFQDSISPDLSPIVVDGNSVGIDADPTATLQQVAVIESLTTNAGIVLKPNGTGAIMASVPDGTATGGNARGQYAVDLQMIRGINTQIAGNRAVIVGGSSNTASGTQSVVVGGQNNIADKLQSFIGGGNGNTIAGGLGENAIVGGTLNTNSGTYGFIGAGFQNTVSQSYGVISGGQSNTASTNTHATVVGGSANTASGQYSVAGGYSNVASGQGAVALGYDATASGYASAAIGNEANASGYEAVAIGRGVASGTRTVAIGRGAYTSGGDSAVAFVGGQVENGAIGSAAFGRSKTTSVAGFSFGDDSLSYLQNQFVQSPINIYGGNTIYLGHSQASQVVAVRQATLSSAATTVLSLDGTGTTNLIIPDGNNRAWNVTVKWVAVCTATGSGTTAVGDVAIATDSFMFKKVSNISSIGTVQNLQNSQDATMAGATCSYAVGGSQDLQITFTAPASANATTFRVVAKVELTEVAW